MFKFLLNKELDKKMCGQFIKDPDFRQGIFELHPELKQVKKAGGDKTTKEIIDDYFNRFYNENREKLEAEKENFQKDWSSVEEGYFELIEGIFSQYEPFEGGYTGYLSIINCNPRFLEDKSFQIYYEHPMGVKYVTSHELLHFGFYEYTAEKFPELFEGRDPNQGIWWDLAELFNDVVLDGDEFQKIHGQMDIPVYPEHEEYLEEFTKLWERTKHIDEFIEKGYESLNGA